MDNRARRCAAALGAISALAAVGLGAGGASATAVASTVQEQREACKAKITARRHSFAAEQVVYREQFKARQEARRSAYVAEGHHTRAENQRFIRMMDRRKKMFHELMERRQQRFNERMHARAEECQNIGRASSTAIAQVAPPEEGGVLPAPEEALRESLLAR